MRIIWTLVKVIVGLAIAIPLALIVLSTAVGIFGALIGLAFFALRIAVLVLLGVLGFKLVGRLFRSTPAPRPALPPPAPVDPHYEAAMRELEQELGERPR